MTCFCFIPIIIHWCPPDSASCRCACPTTNGHCHIGGTTASIPASKLRQLQPFFWFKCQKDPLKRVRLAVARPPLLPELPSTESPVLVVLECPPPTGCLIRFDAIVWPLHQEEAVHLAWTWKCRVEAIAGHPPQAAA